MIPVLIGSSSEGFLAPVAVDTQRQSFSAVSFRMSSHIPGLNPVDTSNLSQPRCDNQKRLQMLSNISWGDKILPPDNR